MHAQMPRNLQDDYAGFVETYPIREQVPVQAVLPKFHGQYLPVEDDISEEVKRSGLFLLEHCGVPIDPKGDDVCVFCSLLSGVALTVVILTVVRSTLFSSACTSKTSCKARSPPATSSFSLDHSLNHPASARWILLPPG